jgi:hypothetical protein
MQITQPGVKKFWELGKHYTEMGKTSFGWSFAYQYIPLRGNKKPNCAFELT